MKKQVGIIGGMGPLATCDLMKKVIELTDAHSDQEHIHIYVDCNTQIPDRTAAILGKGPDPVPQMVRSAVKLQAMGADALIMPCNTAHYFYDRITPFVDIPILHMPQETAKEAKRQGIHTVGLLATDGTIQSGVYKKAFDGEGISVVTPSEEGQKAVMELIYDGIKGGNYKLDLTAFYRILDDLLSRGAETLILGCTELPIAFQVFSIDKPNIDPTSVLAAAAVKFASENE